MSVSGKVISVSPDWRGSVLAVATTTGTTVLTVDDATDFDEDGGWLVISDETTPREYLSVDPDAETITLAAAVGAVFDDTQPVVVWDPDVSGGGARVREDVAMVMLTDSEQAVLATLKHEQIPTAGIDFLIGATVLLEDEDGDDATTDWYVASVLGREPKMLISAQGTLQTMHPSGYPYIQHTLAPNPHEAGTQWAVSRYGVASGWVPGVVWGSSFGSGTGQEGMLRLAAPYPTSLGYETPAFLDMRTKADGTSSAVFRADAMTFSADTWTLGSTTGSSVDFNVHGSNWLQFQQAVGDGRLAVNFNVAGSVELRARSKTTTGQLNMVLDGKTIYLRPEGVGGHMMAFTDGSGRGWVGREWNGSGGEAGIAFTAGGETQSRNWLEALVPHRASSHPTGSDPAWKQGMTPLTDALAALRSITPQRWTWQDSGARDGQPGLGFNAAAVATVVPEAVSGVAIADGGDGLGVDAYTLLGVLWAAVRDIDTRLAAIEGARP